MSRPQADEILGVQEIAQRLGISRQRVYVVMDTYHGFPQPIATLQCGRIWWAPDIEQWAEQWAATEPRRRT